MNDKLAGLHFLLDNGDTFRTGKVLDVIGPSVYLLEFDNMNSGGVRLPFELADLDEMLAGADGIKRFSFFKTRADLDAWTKWLDTPAEDKPKVVSLVKKP